jgi:hypothetical protein
MAVATAIVAAPVVVTNVGGCTAEPATTQPSTPEERQAAAMKDPMNYKPQFETTPDVSDPSGFKKDVNDVFNP